MDNKDIGKSFEKLIDSTFENIDGILVQRGINPVNGDEGYIWGDCWYGSIEEVRTVKGSAVNALKTSIVKIK